MLHLAVGAAVIYAPVRKARHEPLAITVHLDSLDKVSPVQSPPVAEQKPPVRQPAAVRPIAPEKAAGASACRDPAAPA